MADVVTATRADGHATRPAAHNTAGQISGEHNELDDVPQLPEITWGLEFSDANLQKVFLESPEYHALIQSYFNTSIYMLLLSAVFILRRYLFKPQSLGVLVMELFAVVGFIAPAWCYWKVSRAPEAQRFNWRLRWLFFMKIETMGFGTLLLAAMRYMASKRMVQHIRDAGLYEHADPPSLLITVRNLLIASGAADIALLATYAALPFKQLLCFHIYNFTMVMFAFQPIGLHILHCGGDATAVYQICEFMSHIFYVLEAMVLGPNRDYELPGAVCSQDHVTIVVIFLQLVCTYVPLHVCYRLEWCAKMRYLYRLYEEDEPEESHLVYDIGFAACAVMAMWILSSNCHSTLVQLAWPSELHYAECK